MECSTPIPIMATAELNLWDKDLLHETMKILKGRVEYNISKRIPSEIEIGFICFANTGEYSGVLFESENASNLKSFWKN